jgi:hypothetical protein
MIATVWPARACFAPDITHHITRYAVFVGKLVKQPAFARRRPNGTDIFFGEFTVNACRAASGAPISVAHHIRHILFSRNPAKIAGGWIDAIAVTMANLMLRARRGAVERFADEAVDLHRFLSGRCAQSDQGIAPSLANSRGENVPSLGNVRVNAPSYSTQIRNLVSGRARAWFPDFGHDQRVACNRSSRQHFERSLRDGGLS